MIALQSSNSTIILLLLDIWKDYKKQRDLGKNSCRKRFTCSYRFFLWSDNRQMLVKPQKLRRDAMTDKKDIVAEAGLQFFSKASVSISHELKRTLATINESVGLMEDFLLLADRGIPLDTERFKSLAKKLKTLVRRADGCTQNMNKLAHSMDKAVKGIDLGEVVAFVVELSKGIAIMHGVTLEVNSSDSPVSIGTNQFLLQNLMSLCMDFAIHTAGRDKTVMLQVTKADGRAAIRFTHLQGLSETLAKKFPTKKESALLRDLKAEIVTDPKAKELIIKLPDVYQTSIQLAEIAREEEKVDKTTEKILLIDDDEDFLEIMAERLQARGMDVSTTTSPDEALVKIDRESFDAIVIDFMMPGMLGLDVLKEIRMKNPELQIILLTGYATMETGLEAMKLGAMSFVEKPVDLKVLTEKIKKAHKHK
jgi:ActR/RegA family two-component response regulator